SLLCLLVRTLPCLDLPSNAEPRTALQCRARRCFASPRLAQRRKASRRSSFRALCFQLLEGLLGVVSRHAQQALEALEQLGEDGPGVAGGLIPLLEVPVVG